MAGSATASADPSPPRRSHDLADSFDASREALTHAPHDVCIRSKPTHSLSNTTGAKDIMNRKIRTSFAAAGLAGSLLFGGAGIALAQSTTSSTTATTSAAPTAAKLDRSARLTSTLAPLVTAGTITQSQADAVVKAIVAAQPADGLGGPGGRGGGVGHNTALVATTLGITEAQLTTARQSGQTIAQLATSKGVSVQTVIDALVAAEKTEHPDQTEAAIVARVTNQVNGIRPAAPAPTATAA